MTNGQNLLENKRKNLENPQKCNSTKWMKSVINND